MAKKITNCELCGRRMNLQKNNGKMVCSSCSVIRGACKYRRESVLKNIVEFGHCDESQRENVEEICCLVDEVCALGAERDALRERLVNENRI